MKREPKSPAARAAQQLDPEQARRIVLRAQGLTTPATFGAGEKAVLNCVEHLGYVQIDAISVVQRAHLHTLWTRTGDAETIKHLNNLQRRRRKIYEYWAHAASFLPLKDYRFSLPLKAFFKNRAKARGVTPEIQRLKRRILSQVKTEGAMRARDFEAPPNFKSDGWWRHKPAKRALQALFFQGDLMISHRDGFEKTFDVPQRLLPAATNTKMPTPKEEARHMIDTMLRAQGIIAYDDLLHPLRCTSSTKHRALAEKLRTELATAAREGRLTEVMVGGKTAYLHPETLASLPIAAPPAQPMTILSPFDSLVIIRKRLQWLFDFDYSIECYVPAAKRQYGYFCLPILDGERFFGRLDAEAIQQEQRLNIKSLHLESAAGARAGEVDRLLAGLEAFAVFNGCWQITFTKSAASVLSLGKVRYSVS